MMELFRNGGWGMYPILLLGITAVGTAGYFAVRVDGTTRGFLALISKAIIWATIVAVASDLIAVSVHIQGHHLQGDELVAILIEGLGESLSPLVFGPAFLVVTYLLTAIGQRKLDASAA